MPKHDKCRWKGKLVPGSVYKLRLAQSNTVNGNKSIKTEETVDEAVQPPSEETAGRRIVELAELGKQLWCVSCKEALSLDNIVNECRKGLGSVLSVKCHKCLVINIVSTGKQYASADGRCTRFDVNFKAAMGNYCIFHKKRFSENKKFMFVVFLIQELCIQESVGHT